MGCGVVDPDEWNSVGWGLTMRGWSGVGCGVVNMGGMGLYWMALDGLWEGWVGVVEMDSVFVESY